MTSLLPVYSKLELDIDTASGQYIWDVSGKKYIDFLSGISVTNMGHCAGAVTEAVSSSMEKYMHISNLFKDQNQEDLADELVKRSFSSKVFFSNSGAEANECAIKAARKYFNGEKYEIITFKNSFHGRTLATLAATGQNKFREGFGPVSPGFVYAEYNFLASVEDKVNDKTCAIMLEPVLGEGGVIPATNNFMQGLKEICEANKILLIFDEIQTGLGRTGKNFAYEYYNITPDIMTLGKSLGAGLPLAATLMVDKVASALKKGDHGSTFGGNPLACAAGLASLKMLDDKILDYICREGEILKNGLISLSKRYDCVKEVRGLGLMLAMELDIKGQEMVEHMLEHGFIINCTKEKIIRFLPPFVVRGRDIEELISAMDDFLKEKQ